jgi:hypothetical protein
MQMLAILLLGLSAISAIMALMAGAVDEPKLALRLIIMAGCSFLAVLFV